MPGAPLPPRRPLRPDRHDLQPRPRRHGEHPLFVVLDVYGDYFFAPAWNAYGYTFVEVTPGTRTLEIIPPFTWPPDAGTADGLYFYAALTNLARTELFGAYGSWGFGWGR